MKASHATTVLFLLLSHFAAAQTYYGASWHNPGVGFWQGHSELHKITIANNSCTVQDIGMILHPTYDSMLINYFCYCPNNFIYADMVDDSLNLFKIDPQTAHIVDIIPLAPAQGNLRGMVCNESNIIHAVSNDGPNTKFVEINPINGALTVLNTSNEASYGDLVQYDSVWYTWAYEGVRRLDLDSQPFETELLYNINSNYGGVSVFPSLCNTFVFTQWNTQYTDIYLANIDQHTNTFLCSTNTHFNQLVNVEGDYYDPDPSCTVPIDLDRNNGSGAVGNDYNSAIFDCKTNHVKIADNDAFIPAYPIIDTMRISITGGILDPGNERLFISQPPTGIATSGSNTTTITLTNASGNARVADFLTALKQIQYKDIALSPIGGLREITVSFVTRQGFPTDTAKCFVQVQQHPQIPVDLGPDMAICQGDFATLDAGNPGFTYYWVGGQTTQSINAFTTSTYKVTVSDGVRCPGADEVVVKVLPNIPANVLGADTICVGDTVLLNFQWNNPGTFNLNMTNSIGQTEYLPGVVNGDNYIVVPPSLSMGGSTNYNLNYYFEQVVLFNSPACLQFDQPAHTIRVNASPTGSQNAYICQGDSIFIGTAWQTQSGVYPSYFTLATGCTQTVYTNLTVFTPGNQTTYLQTTTCDPSLAGVFTQTLQSFNGCDSTIVTNVLLNQGDTIYLASQTCDPTMAGIFTQNLTNQSGCDSTIITSVLLNQSDTVYLAAQTCDPALAGVFTQNLMNQNGCDSTIITTVLLNQSDTTFLAAQTCNPALAGIFTQNLTNQNGCDSTIITNVLFSQGDTVLIAGQTCDPALAGIFTQNLMNQNGCDSTIITSIILNQGDTVLIASQTCDPGMAGVFTQTLMNQNGCDSTVITNVLLSQADTVLIASQTCDPALAGIFTQNLTNQNGCDSTIITSILLNQGDTVLIAAQTCDPALAGIFTQNLTNQNGCDSTIITNVLLNQGDTVLIAAQTCDPTMAGVFTQNLMNQSGCDSTIITSVLLNQGDTVLIAAQTCDPGMAGVSTAIFTNQFGCDSVVVSTTTLLNADTTLLTVFTCEPTEVGTFMLLLTNADGCDSLVVEVVSLLPADSCQTVQPPSEVRPQVYTPNAFSPNGDGINDFFTLFANERVASVGSLQVYSRWGEQVFEAYNQLPNDLSAGWDGDFRGKPMGFGIYLFWAEVLDVEGNTILVKGEVMLMR